MVVDLSNSADLKFHPSLYNIHRILDENIVGEFSSRMSLFTSWILGDNFVIISGPRSSGKTWISDNVKQLVGDLELDNGRCYVLKSGSEKSAWYDMENIRKADYILVLELNKIPKEAAEVLKDWGEGKESIYKSVIFEGGVRQLKTYKLPPKPFVFCLADEEEANIGEQLSSRLTNIRTDATVTQNKNVLLQQAKLSMEPTNIKLVNGELKKQIREHLRTLPPYNKYKFKHPCSNLFIDNIPTFFTDCRRDFPKYIANVSGICRFYWKDRVVDEDNKFMFVTPQDMYLNHVIYGQILVESALKVNNIEREIIYTIKGSGEDLVDKKTIQRLLRKRGINVSSHMIARHLNSLSDMGYLNKETSKDNKTPLYSAGDFFEEFKFSMNWKKVVEESVKNMKRLYPKFAKEYEDRYCKNPIVDNPYTGEKINLMDLKEELVEPSKDKLTSFLKDVKEEPKEKLTSQERVKIKEIMSHKQQAEEPKEEDMYEVVEEETIE